MSRFTRRRGYVTAWDKRCAALLERAATLPEQPDLSTPLGEWAAVEPLLELPQRLVLGKVISRLGWSPELFLVEANEIRQAGLQAQDEDDIPF